MASPFSDSIVFSVHTWKQRFQKDVNFCKDHRNKIEVSDPLAVEDLISSKLNNKRPRRVGQKLWNASSIFYFLVFVWKRISVDRASGRAKAEQTVLSNYLREPNGLTRWAADKVIKNALVPIKSWSRVTCILNGTLSPDKKGSGRIITHNWVLCEITCCCKNSGERFRMAPFSVIVSAL